MLQLEVIGNLGNDAEIKDINGKKYVSFNVAHSEKHDGVESTTWVSVLWYGEGGALTQYLKRGTKVFVRGRMYVKTFAKNGVTQVGVNLTATEVTLCGMKEATNG